MPTCTAPARRRMRSPPAWTDRSASRWPTARVDNRLLGSTLGIDPARGQPARSGRPRRHQRDRVLRRPYRRQPRHRHAALAGARSSLLTMDGGGSMNLGAETLDLHVRPQARRGRHRPRRAAARQRLVPRTVRRARPRRGGRRECRNVAGGAPRHATPLGAIAGALGGSKLLGGAGGATAARPSRRRGQPAGRTAAAGRQPAASPPAGTAAEAAQPRQRC